jgi:chemotaxis protein histidine kinase CheA
MLPDQFNDRLDAVRRRFASSLESNIKDIDAELPNLSDGCVNAVDVVANAYRRIHGISGVGGAIGFAATSRAAKDVENVLIGAYRDQRGLAAAEISRLEKMLGALAVVARAELSSNRGFSASKNEK